MVKFVEFLVIVKGVADYSSQQGAKGKEGMNYLFTLEQICDSPYL